ncbi:hypothetical protein ESA94_08845 [Lacibacter luteus]|uniref:Uncharacterized protein n=1 Tax=Lacibacter luteus TaxID=2508719 RepID=A0A4V1M7M2_9BACT|nr:hypothetical protein [Lacibacter luteus]RXK60565.1 hypothetical protein ESA94_08845 [Lacibacter luteus]
MSTFLLKIIRIEDSVINDTLILPFKDETDELPSDDFELYELLHNKPTGSLSSDVIDSMKRNYVGKRFRIAAYETGEFAGLPDGYEEYQDTKAGQDFHFRNYLTVIGIIKKNNASD